MIDGLNAVVVGTEEDDSIPKNHVAIFLGAEGSKRESKGGAENPRPVALVVPIEVCEDGQIPVFKFPEPED